MAVPTVFVTAATGTQGEAVARQLRELGWEVHATVRDLEAPAAKHLEALGVKTVQGDWDNMTALKASITGCDMLFLNLRPAFERGDTSHERVQAQGILDIAKSSGVQHVIYSSGVCVDRLDRLTVLDPNGVAAASLHSKAAIEALVMGFGFTHWTILRGCNFMANFLQPKIQMYVGFLETNTWTTAWTRDTQMPLVDCEDIAKFAVAAFSDPKKYHQQGITIAGDLLTAGQIVAQLSAATGRELKAAFYTEEEIAAQGKTNPFINGQLAMRKMREFVDFDELKSWGVPLNDFKTFLGRETKALQETYH